MATKKRKLNYSYSPTTQELMVTTIDPKDLDKVENIMLDTEHYLHWDPKTKEVVGFFALFVDPKEKKEKFYSFPSAKDVRPLGFKNFFKQLAESYS